MCEFDKRSTRRNLEKAWELKLPNFHYEIRRPSATPIEMRAVNLDHFITLHEDRTKISKKEFALSEIVKKYKDKLKKLPSVSQSPTLSKDRTIYSTCQRNSQNFYKLRSPYDYFTQVSNKFTPSPDPTKLSPMSKLPKLEHLNHKSPKSSRPSPKEKLTAKEKLRQLLDSCNCIQAYTCNDTEVSKKFLIHPTDEPHKIRLKGNKMRKNSHTYKNRYGKDAALHDVKAKMVDKEVFNETDDVWSSLSSW
jgi:hypothetical protein